MCVCASVCMCVSWLTASLCVSVCSSALPSSAVNSKWHSSHIFRPDMSPTWHSHISDLTCWHAVSRQEAMEQSKLMLSRERQRKGEGGYAATADSAVHPPKVQMRTGSYTRCLEINHSLLEGSRQERRSEFQWYKFIPSSIWKQIKLFLCDDTQDKNPILILFWLFLPITYLKGLQETCRDHRRPMAHQALGKDHLWSYTSEQNKRLKEDKTSIWDRKASPW